MEAETKYLPNVENMTFNDGSHETYHYCDDNGKPVFKTKEIFYQEKRFIFYPYVVNRIDGSVKAKRIKSLEFLGWDSIASIPDDFKTENKYGLRKLRAKILFNVLYSKFRDIGDFTIGINIKNSFKHNHIDLNWADIRSILNEINKEKNSYDREKASLVNKQLSKINTNLVLAPRYLPAGDLERFLNKYNSFEKINSNDLNALSAVLDLVPPSVINTTSNFINSKEQINRVFIEDVIHKFEKLMTSIKDNEKKWQSFFAEHAWVLSHLFSYEVILKEKEAYVGGKTIGNDDGRIVDFLFENGFRDNYALLEIKTHKKELLKKVPYRKPNAFAMSDDLSGGISQCLDQKDVFIKENGVKNPSFDPQCILLIGRKTNLGENQKKCFELIRANQKAVAIVTFDEVLEKLKGLLKVLKL